ncbi:MAG: patatin-like phospholipase family protein, partial [Bacteroidetes bacterium]|nr:patatin-like phospholipase family protein [Bacteroidota bacterium]
MIRSITFLITVIVTGLSAGTLFAQHLNSTHATTSAPVVSFRSAVPMRTVITAQNKEGVRSPWQPHLGLVLSGGGARGLAQIGLLRALEEAGIRPDLIVGTSIGSIIGGLYASGYNARRLQHTIRDIEWNKIMRMHDAADRNFLSLDHKPISDRSILTLRFDGLQPILPQAVSNGQRLTNLLNELTLQALYHADDFDHLGIPFRAVATDLHSGKSVTLSSGGLAECMRASSTLPVMYSPVVRDSLLLVDGGLLANIPVNVARAEGCEYILAVNTTSPLRDSDQLNTAFDVIDQVFNIVMIPPGEEQLAQADMVIAPDLRHVDGMDFSIADSLIAIGYASAKEKVN